MRIRTSTIILSLFIGASITAGSLATINAQTSRKPAAKPAVSSKVYSCPMHPEVTSSRRRKCPKCGMTLRIAKAEAPLVAMPVANPMPGQGPNGPTFLSMNTLPDVEVLDQNGKRLRFWTDLMKDKTVAINFIFTTCTTICPPLTATFRRVQQDLHAQNIPAQLISISVDPTTDTPERLRAFADKFKAGPGWTFVTGEKAAIDSILQTFGTAVPNKNDHTPMVVVMNNPKGTTTRVYGLSSPATLVKVINEIASAK